MTFRAKGSGTLCLCQDFWDRHATNIATCWEAMYGERLFRRQNKRLRGDPRNVCANTRIRILSRERSSRKHKDPITGNSFKLLNIE